MGLFCFYNQQAVLTILPVIPCRDVRNQETNMRYLPLLLLGLGCLAHAGIYKTYDKNGNVVFSDTPTSNAEEVADKPVATMPALPRDVIDKKLKIKPQNPAEVAPASYKISLDKLKTNDVLRHGEPALTALIQLEPQLWHAHHLLLSQDGKELARDTFSVSIDPSALERGQHRLEIKAVNNKGEVLTTEVVDFFVQQTTAVKAKTK